MIQTLTDVNKHSRCVGLHRTACLHTESDAHEQGDDQTMRSQVHKLQLLFLKYSDCHFTFIR